MRYLVVSSFPPERCGIAAYAAQQVRALRRDGHRVDVLTWAPGRGDISASLNGGVRPLRLLRHARRYDRVVVHHEPALYHSRRGGPLTVAAWCAVNVLARNVTYICHEARDPDGTGMGRLRRGLERLRWRTAPQVAVHSAAQAARLHRIAGGLDPARLEIRDHGADFVARFAGGRAEARRRVGLGDDDRGLVLCIGFLHDLKGFDRAVDAFRRAAPASLRLVIVGGARTTAQREFASRLRRLVAAVPDAELHEGHVDDATFDAWIRAADLVVLPYREAWSSGVAARARLLGTPLLVTRTGALPEQCGPGDIVVDGDDGLVEALRALDRRPRVAAAG